MTVRQQQVAFAVLSLAALGLVAVLTPSHAALFQRYFGGLHPLLVMVLVIAIGALCLYWLYTREWFVVFKPSDSRRGLTVAAALATLFAAAMIAVDVIKPYPADINAPLPEALLFYPAIAFVVEIIFHVLPLTLWLIVLGRLPTRLSRSRLLWSGIVVTALLEPTFQLVLTEGRIGWVGVFLWVHLFFFSVVQLAIFRRYDFVSMLAFRLVYYLFWHIIWGYWRLEVLYSFA